jgi:hypothetical protein
LLPFRYGLNFSAGGKKNGFEFGWKEVLKPEINGITALKPKGN